MDHLYETESREDTLRKRTIGDVVRYVIAAIVIIGMIPLSSFVFKAYLKTDLDINPVSDLVSFIIPKDILQSGLAKLDSIGAPVDEEAMAELNADQLENVSSDPNILAETTPVSDSYFDDTLIIADGMYTGFVEEELYPAGNILTFTNFTPEGIKDANIKDPNTQVQGNVYDIISARHPKRVYIMFGYTGLAKADEEFYTGWEEAIENIRSASSQCKIVLVTAPPYFEVSTEDDSDEEPTIVDELEEKDPVMTNQVVTEFNDKLLQIARSKSVYLLETYDSLVSGDTLKEEYQDSELIINEDGLRRILDVVKKHAIPE